MANVLEGNLSSAVSEQDLHRGFQPFGDLLGVLIILDRRALQSRGFAFVNLCLEVEGRAAVARLNRKELRGRRKRMVYTGTTGDRADRTFGSFAPDSSERASRGGNEGVKAAL